MLGDGCGKEDAWTQLELFRGSNSAPNTSAKVVTRHLWPLEQAAGLVFLQRTAANFLT